MSQISAGPSTWRRSERRSDRCAGDRLAGALDLCERDQNSTSVPTPSSRALRTISSAAARSSTARPSDLKTVSSSASARPGCEPVSTSPSSARMCSSPEAGEQQVARLVQRRLAPVDEEAARDHRLGVELADGRHARSDGVHVRARREPLAPEDRLVRARARAHDVRALEHRLGCAAVPAAPRPDLDVAEHGAHRLGVGARLHAGAEDRDRARVRPCERPRGDSGDRGRADLGDRRSVQDRLQLAGLAVVEEDRALVCVEPAGGIAGRDHDLLQRPRRAVPAPVGRHEAHQAVRARRARHESERLVQLAARERTEDVRPSPRCTRPSAAAGGRRARG